MAMIVGEEMQLLQTCEWDRGGRRVFNVAMSGSAGSACTGLGIVLHSTITPKLERYNTYVFSTESLWTTSRGVSVQGVGVSVIRRSGGLH